MNNSFYVQSMTKVMNHAASKQFLTYLQAKKKKKMSLVYIKASYLKRRKLWWSEDKINKYNSNNN